MNIPASAPSPAFEDARQRAVRLLTDAYAYDVIDDVEFERRLDLLAAAQGSAGIDLVVSDLPVSARIQDAMASGMRPTLLDTASIVGFMSDLRRKGPWRVPQRLKVRAFMSGVKLDLRYAAIPAGCEIDVSAMMANVTLIVAPDLIVQFDVTPLLGSARSDSTFGDLRGHVVPHLTVTGSAFMAEVRVKVRPYD